MDFDLIKQLLDDSRKREIELDKKLKETQAELKDIKAELEEKDEEIKDLFEANNLLKEKSSKLEEKNSKLNDMLTETTLKLESENYRLNCENKKLNTEVDLQAQRYSELKRENERLKLLIEQQLQRRPEQLPLRSDSSSYTAAVSSTSSFTDTDCAADDVCSPTSGQIQMAHTPSGSSVTMTPTEPLTLLDILNTLVPAADEWKMIGLNFKIPLSRLNSIQNENPHSDKKCLTEAIDFWMKNQTNDSPPVTIQSINTILESPSVKRADLKISF